MDNLKLVSLNVRGLRGNKRYVIYRWIRGNKLDVCLLQETFCTKEFTDKIKRGWNGKMIHSCSLSNHSKGVCILLAKDLPCKVISTHRDGDGQIILINIELNNVEYSICNIYCPNNVSDRIAFLQYVNEFVKSHAVSKNRNLIGGDFNCADSPDDRSNGIVDSSTKLASLKSSLQLEDVWRQFNPNKIEYSYIDPSGRGFKSRIDLWLGSRNIISDTVTCVMRQAPTPDHNAILAEIKVRHRPNTRGKDYWKMNNSVINEENYREGISKLFDDTQEEYGEHVPKSVLWEYLKIKIKEFTISYCTSRRHDRRSTTIRTVCFVKKLRRF